MKDDATHSAWLCVLKNAYPIRIVVVVIVSTASIRIVVIIAATASIGIIVSATV